MFALLPDLHHLQGECAKVNSINDRNDWKSVKNALSVMHFDLSDIEVRT